ncbi:MAG TPA: rhomboid family intramembrane serine protease, partial [Chromatiales bacterium]|nr:rhomboid family intramembrane serine protease [Chromatiales bacterium]
MFPIHDDNPTTMPPVVTVSLIVACTLVFLWQTTLGSEGQQAIIYALGVIPALLFDLKELPPEMAIVPPKATILTSMFLHGGWMHLIGNMLYLWIFGNNVEEAMGHVRFIIFYLICGVMAVFAQALPNPDSEIPMVGASGAIAGVLGAYLLLYPHAKVLVVIPIGFIIQTMRLPASIVLGFWFVLQFVSNLFASDTGGGVAFSAHIGGFVAGLALVSFLKRRGVPLFSPAH